MPSKRITAGALIVLALLLTAGAISQWYVTREYRLVRAQQQTMLARRVHEMRADTLFAAIAQLTDQTGVPIEIDIKSLAVTGIDAGSPCYQRLFDVRLETALNVLAAGRYALVPLCWCWQDGKVVITSPDAALPNRAVLRVYNARKSRTLQTYIQYQKQLDAEESPPMSGPSLFGGSSQRTAAEREEDIEDGVVRIIEEEVATESWRDAGGLSGWMAMNDGRLIVRQTAQGHREVKTYLHQLETEDACDGSAK